MIERADPSLR